MFGLVNCKACRGNANQSTDTVKVSFPPPNAEDKENAGPAFGQENLAEEQEALKERERLEREEHAREERAREEQRLREEQERRAEEERRAREEELARQRAEEERQRQLAEEERQRQLAEEERKRQEALLAEEVARKQREEAERVRKQEQLQQWLAKSGFGAVNEKKKKSGMLSSGFSYPLHAAVKAEDAGAVELLLWGGADKSLQDSAKLTPLALAQKLGKKGSHRQVIAALQA